MLQILSVVFVIVVVAVRQIFKPSRLFIVTGQNEQNKMQGSGLLGFWTLSQ
jgi:hypothetical protein